MTLADISAKITKLTGAGTDQYTLASRLIDINIWYRNVQTHIMKSQDDWDFDDSNNSDFPIWSTNLVAGQQDYSLPSNMLELKRAEITYDGVTWNKITLFDIGTRTLSTATNAISDFTTGAPKADLQYGSLFAYPIPQQNVVAGLKLWGTRAVTEFTLADLTAGTLSPGFDVLFHDIIAYGASSEFCLEKELARGKGIDIKLEQKLALLENRYGQKNEDEQMSVVKQYSSYK